MNSCFVFKRIIKMDTEKIIEMLQQKYDDNEKAYKEMLKANTNEDLNVVLRACSIYFEGLQESKDDCLFKHNWLRREWFGEKEFYGYTMLETYQVNLEPVRDLIHYGINSQCRYIRNRLKQMINSLKNGKDYKTYIEKGRSRKKNHDKSCERCNIMLRNK